MPLPTVNILPKWLPILVDSDYTDNIIDWPLVKLSKQHYLLCNVAIYCCREHLFRCLINSRTGTYCISTCSAYKYNIRIDYNDWNTQ